LSREALVDASFAWLRLDIVGVFGAPGDLAAPGEALDAAEVFAIETGAGRVVVLLAEGFPTVPAVAAGLVWPLVFPFDVLPACVVALRVEPMVFFFSSFVSAAFVASFFESPNFLSTSVDGVSTAVSGMASPITELFFLALTSAASDSVRSAVAPG